MINLEQLSQLSQSEALLEIHKSLIIPNLLILYVSFALIFLITGLAMINTRRSGYGKFLKIYFTTLAVSFVVILLPLILLPNMVNDFIGFFTGLV